MKWIGAFLLAFLMTACTVENEDVAPQRESDYLPVLMDADKLEGSIAYQPHKALENPGKFYLYGDFVFVSERYKGVHIINNADPENPFNVAFVSIPGCVDIAVKGTHLYADNATDLVAIDLSGLQSLRETKEVVVTKRLEGVLPEPSPPDGLEVPYEFRKENRPDNTVIVEWKKNPEAD